MKVGQEESPAGRGASRKGDFEGDVFVLLFGALGASFSRYGLRKEGLDLMGR